MQPRTSVHLKLVSENGVEAALTPGGRWEGAPGGGKKEKKSVCPAGSKDGQGVSLLCHPRLHLHNSIQALEEGEWGTRLATILSELPSSKE